MNFRETIITVLNGVPSQMWNNKEVARMNIPRNRSLMTFQSIMTVPRYNRGAPVGLAENCNTDIPRIMLMAETIRRVYRRIETISAIFEAGLYDATHVCVGSDLRNQRRFHHYTLPSKVKRGANQILPNPN